MRVPYLGERLGWRQPHEGICTLLGHTFRIEYWQSTDSTNSSARGATRYTGRGQA
jgi:hypothetical protein